MLDTVRTMAGGRFCVMAALTANSRGGPTSRLLFTAGWLCPHPSVGAYLIPWELVQLGNPAKHTSFFPSVDLAHQEFRGVPEQVGACGLRHSSCLAELSTYAKKINESSAIPIRFPSDVSELLKWLWEECASWLCEAVVPLGDVH